MSHVVKPRLFLTLTLLVSIPATSYATNGMNLEGYGPEALGMGGAAMAYDNGTAAVMNNPATLGLMGYNNRLDIALGLLGPDITSSVPDGSSAKSTGDAYYMPAVGYIRKTGNLSWGVGMFSQGGMGTEYSGDSFMASGSGKPVRSEVGVGRLIFPLNIAINSNFNVAASVDFVWAGMDLQMAMDGNQFGDLVSTHNAGEASGTLVDSFLAFGLPTNFAYFDFSNSNNFSGEAKATGFAGKIGFTYTITPKFIIGASYHSKTSLGDLETDNAKVTMNVDASGFGFPSKTPIALSGNIKVKDFQWPDTYGLGVSWQAIDNLLLVADVKRINWSNVMENFSMTFTASQDSANNFSGSFGPSADLRGQYLDAVLYQQWEDQTVIQFGTAYGVTNALTLRAGFNYASNPVPDKYLNALFPATVENHLTLGLGYDINQKGSTVDFGLSRGFENTSTNSQNQVTTAHAQLNWQIMYSNRF